MVNIFLIPYTFARHVSMALWCGVVGLLSWWVVLTAIVKGGLDWIPTWDGPLLLGSIAAGVAMASVLGESNLLRRPLLGRVWRTALAGALAFGLALVWYGLWHVVSLRLLAAATDLAADALDASLVSLSFRFGAFGAAGLGTGLACAIVRRGQGLATHAAAGVASGLAGGITWHLLSANLRFGLSTGDLYLAGAGMGLAWGMVFGLLAWGIPDSLYAGWIRVLSDYRHGHRIPVDGGDGESRERYVGHFPRGLDVYLPVQEGVMELHLSVAVDKDRAYRARGLSLQPTRVRRFLERVDLRYDPRRPAPLETRLSSGDRILLGEGEHEAELEFLMLPREEQ